MSLFCRLTYWTFQQAFHRAQSQPVGFSGFHIRERGSLPSFSLTRLGWMTGLDGVQYLKSRQLLRQILVLGSLVKRADGKMLVMTPIDPAFLLIPILQAVYPGNGDQGMFRPADEIFEDAAVNLEQSSTSTAGKDISLIVSKDDVLQFTSLECCKSALNRVCDVKEITEDITVYRFSPEKVVQYLRVKVQRLSNPETFEVSRTLIRNLAKDGLMEDGKENLLKVGRVRAACDLVAQYTPPGICSLLTASYDFTPLDAHFKSIEEENAALSIEKAVKPKPAPTTVDKKRKPGTSQGVEKLKKAKTGGMAKLSTFFAKKAPT